MDFKQLIKSLDENLIFILKIILMVYFKKISLKEKMKLKSFNIELMK